MGWFRSTWSWLTLSAEGVPQLQFDASTETPPRPVDDVIRDMFAQTGRVGRDAALSVPGVLRGRNLVCSVATLPLHQLDANNTVHRMPLLEQIDPDVPNVVTLSQTLEDLFFEGASYWRITGRDAQGWPVSARHIDYTSVTLNPPDGYNPAPLPSGDDPRGAKIWIDGKAASWSDVIMFQSPNPGLLKAAGQPIRQAIALEKTAQMYADNPRPLDYFAPSAGEADPEDDVIVDIIRSWQRARRAGSTGYVPAALTYNTVDTPTPADLQLVDRQRRLDLALANAMGLDPEDLGISTTSRTYQNGVDRRQERINDVFSPFMKAITDRLSMGDVTRRGYRVVFDLDDYLRADPMTRAQVYQRGIEDGWLLKSEVRAEERLTPKPGIDQASQEPARPAVPDSPAALAGMPGVRFDDDDVLTFDAPDPERFEVDQTKRTVEGIVMPFGRIATKNGRRYRFAPGSLKYADPSRVKLLRDHDNSQAVGRMIHHEEREDGVFGRFRVAHGPDGDRALAEADDGIRDGFSVGVDIVRTAPDPENRGVLLVLEALWRETSLLAVPAYDDARVTRVAASRDQGDQMDPCTTCGTPHAPSAGCTPATVAAPAVAFTGDQFAQLIGAIRPNQPNTADERPALITPPTVQVIEPAPYAFDRRGNIRRGTHEFSHDLHLAARGDKTAEERVLAFTAEQFDATTTTDTAGLNPNRQVPSLYVDQRDYRYPVWDAINKGTLSDITPFTFPKFSAASGLVGAHTQGTEPTVGDMTWTTQTVTPTAISGKAEINREVIDQGGNPQASNLIWRQMVRGYNESLEAAAVAVLDAASPTAIALTAGGGTTGQTLAAELTSALAKLQFVRGGYRFTDAFAQVDLYTALTGALDDDGRPLFPQIGPTNADGTVSNLFTSVNIAGQRFWPSWALAASGTVVASSYLFDREAVHGWASAPRELRFDYQVKSVFIGIWGYVATAISDIAGVREITYDPAP